MLFRYPYLLYSSIHNEILSRHTLKSLEVFIFDCNVSHKINDWRDKKYVIRNWVSSLYSGWKMISLNTLSSFIFKNTFSSTETESATDIKTDLNISLFLILSFQFGYYGVCYISKVKILLSIIKKREIQETIFA